MLCKHFSVLIIILLFIFNVCYQDYHLAIQNHISPLKALMSSMKTYLWKKHSYELIAYISYHLLKYRDDLTIDQDYNPHHVAYNLYLTHMSFYNFACNSPLYLFFIL